MRATCTQNIGRFGAFLKKLVPEPGPGSIFSKFGLVFVASDKIWWLEFIGSVTGSGNAPQEGDIGL